jgi:hypothetical protein
LPSPTRRARFVASSCGTCGNFASTSRPLSAERSSPADTAAALMASDAKLVPWRRPRTMEPKDGHPTTLGLSLLRKPRITARARARRSALGPCCRCVSSSTARAPRSGADWDLLQARGHLYRAACRGCATGSWSSCWTARDSGADPGGYAQVVRIPALEHRALAERFTDRGFVVA